MSHNNVHSCVCVYIYKLVTVVEGDQKAPFSIATTSRCKEGCYSFPWIAPLYPWCLLYNTECLARRYKVVFLKSIGMTRPGIECRSPGALANTIKPVSWAIIYGCMCVCLCMFMDGWPTIGILSSASFRLCQIVCNIFCPFWHKYRAVPVWTCKTRSKGQVEQKTLVTYEWDADSKSHTFKAKDVRPVSRS